EGGVQVGVDVRGVLGGRGVGGEGHALDCDTGGNVAGNVKGDHPPASQVAAYSTHEEMLPLPVARRPPGVVFVQGVVLARVELDDPSCHGWNASGEEPDERDPTTPTRTKSHCCHSLVASDSYRGSVAGSYTADARSG